MRRAAARLHLNPNLGKPSPLAPPPTPAQEHLLLSQKSLHIFELSPNAVAEPGVMGTKRQWVWGKSHSERTAPSARTEVLELLAGIYKPTFRLV